MWEESEFFEYKNGMRLEDIPEDKVCILLMQQLRQMDSIITRGLSYERTVYMFLANLELDEHLSVFKKLKNCVILLDRAGALIKKKGSWSVIFDPKETEGLTIGEEEPLYPIFKEMCTRRIAEGEMTMLPLHHIPIRTLLNPRFQLNFLDTYCSSYPGGYLAVAQNVVINGTKELFQNVPVCTYGALTSVDIGEIEGYHTIKSLLDDYLLQVEYSKGAQVKPLTIAVFGAPGSGKSFGIKQIAKSAGDFETSTLNLSQFKEYDEMTVALADALNNDSGKTPLIFFDEFDSDYKGTPRGWLKFLLAPMQDGEFNCKGKTVSINQAVFVFAGGTASSFEEFLPTTEEETELFKQIKGPDFVSRLKGTLSIKGPNPVSITDKSYIIRRALILRDLIKRKCPSIYDEQFGQVSISKGLLSTLLRVSNYKHGTRSLEFILDMSRLTDVDKYIPACLPHASQLTIHVDTADLFRKLSSTRINDETFEAFCENVHGTRIRMNQAKAKSDKEKKQQLKKNPSLQPWDKLSEEFKEEYRIKLRNMLENMSSIDFPIGIRPRSKKIAKDTIKEMCGEELTIYAKLDYAETLRHKMALGWIYGEKLDEEIKISPTILPWEELTEEQQKKYEEKVKAFPEYLKAVNLELYRKPF